MRVLISSILVVRYNESMLDNLFKINHCFAFYTLCVLVKD